jgi:hypothetical protein
MEIEFFMKSSVSLLEITVCPFAAVICELAEVTTCSARCEGLAGGRLNLALAVEIDHPEKQASNIA